MTTTLADDSTMLAMSACLQHIWPDTNGQSYLEDEGIRSAIYKACDFTDEEIAAHDTAALARERARREAWAR
jgi:hypothetical protein